MLLKSFLSYVLFACCVLSMVIGWLLWSRRQANPYANRLLAALLFVYVYIDFVTLLITNGGIVYVPHLFRTAAPFNFLIGPLMYLYVHACLLSVTRFEVRRFGWLFLPFVLNVLEFMPFYGQPTAVKLARIQELAFAPDSLVSITEGILSPQFHLLSYSLSNFAYALLVARLWWTYRQQEVPTTYTNPAFADWLRLFVLVHLITNGVWLIQVPFVQVAPYGNLMLNLTNIIAQLVICFSIIQRPTLLYGAYTLSSPAGPPNSSVAPPPGNPPPLPDATDPATRPSESTDEAAATAGAVEQEIMDKLAQLNQYMLSQQPYLRPRLSLADVSVATQIPPYLLSAMLNRVLGLDFRDYVNAHRVRHLCQLLESHQYGHLTLEGISTQAGFSSKATFYRAFQKHTGVTPAQYLQRTDTTDN